MASGSQSAHWVFDELPTSGSVTILFELLATDQVSGGPGVDARFWLEFGPLVDGVELAASTAPLLMALPNVSPMDDPLRYLDARLVWLPPRGPGSLRARRWSAATPAASGAPHRGRSPGVDGLWVTIGRLGPDGSVISEHIAVRKSSVQLQAAAGGGTTGDGDVTADATPEPTPAPTPTPEPTASPGPERAARRARRPSSRSATPSSPGRAVDGQATPSPTTRAPTPWARRPTTTSRVGR